MINLEYATEQESLVNGCWVVPLRGLCPLYGPIPLKNVHTASSHEVTLNSMAVGNLPKRA